MKYAVISDIHANLEAFLSVLEEIDSLRPDAVICLGDIVGYGADPNACADIIRERKIPSVMGNHDAAASGVTEPWNFNEAAKEAALWTRDELTDENRNFLAALPDRIETEHFLAVHGAISDPDKYILSYRDAEPEFGLMDDYSLGFFGHTHVPADHRSPAGPERRLVNPGSVGQPRDGDPRAAFLVYDTESGVELRRAEYDIRSAQRKIIGSGLDSRLAERLSYGY
ncbi:MAG: metallophosphoesterase family protein [Candidatus Dadabacteria bacterium]|nr:metallophosphoesterase family protein [Candidatus Dadabacteria bacterium]